ncbi:osiris 11 [Haematobia irritans]|uniref:osiris 11 n=1 Tax=Haematobia irritans TaxID=7368 RepID=UPI003F4FED28
MYTKIPCRLVMVMCAFHIATSIELPVLTVAQSGRGLFTDNTVSRTVNHVLNHCLNQDDILWCFKIQGAKLLGRALKFQNINIVEGVTLIKKNDTELRNGRSSVMDMKLTNRDLENLSEKSLDSLLMERLATFVKSRQLQVNLPRLLTFGQGSGREWLQSIMNFFTSTTEEANKAAEEMVSGEVEGRKKKDDKKYLGPFIAAVMLKAAILKMAYHSIAIVAGKALIVGKIALIISAIIGLKKLVSSEGGEKTTYEIVKHPQVQQSHTYSSSHQNEYEGGHESSGSYHRSIDDEMMMQDKAYSAWVPTTS